MIYLDNAATSWPKPPSVVAAAAEAIESCAGNPGRGNYRSASEVGGVLDDTRGSLAKLFGACDPRRIVFASNATDTLNLAIFGTVPVGSHVVTSSMEHNAVARPLFRLKEKGVRVTEVRMDPAAGADPTDIEAAICADTSLVVLCHASNVTGTLNPITDIGKICKGKGVPFLVDAAQTAGSIPIDVTEMNIDMLAFPGHKGLLGPMGTGGLYIAEGLSPDPVRYGGTGVYSELSGQPDELPYRYEAGTQNAHGLAALNAAVKFILSETPQTIGSREHELTDRLTEMLSEIEGVVLYGPPKGSPRAAVISINIEGIDCMDAATVLDASFGVAARAGLHCAPHAHHTLGTADKGGTLRLSPGYFTTEKEIEECAFAVAAIARESR